MEPLPYPKPRKEAHRLAALRDLGILDTERSPAFDRLCRITCEALNAPIAAVSLIDEDRQWLKAECGLDGGITETPREYAFCTYTVLHDEVFVISDTRADARFRANPYVIGEPRIRFYAGVPLSLGSDLRIGSLCVIDRRPRDFTPDQAMILRGLARLVVDEIWLHHLVNQGFTSEPPRLATNLDFTVKPEVTGAQLRAGRGLLRWSAGTLARRAGVSLNTVKRAELEDGQPPLRAESLAALTEALREGGVEWVFSPGRHPGVRLRAGRDAQ